MKILILGATGMLGHRLFIELSKQHDVWGTYKGWRQFLPEDKTFCFLIGGLNWESKARSIVETVRPDVIINCVAVIRVKDRFAKLEALTVNAALPYELMYLAHEYKARLIHFSTDAVFSGRQGGYIETDTTDPIDAYGMSKCLGEIADQPHVLTLRCCPIGRELPLSAKGSLVEWFLAQKGEVRGYSKACFTPMSTHEIARIVSDYILHRGDVHGIKHLSSGAKISKYQLLCLLKDYFKHDVEIIPDETVVIDRSLDSDQTKMQLGGWYGGYVHMLETMTADNALYEGERI